ncbi:MAG: formate dehydrogenase subunit gamma [Hyphomicrobiaceae bacterium]|nr:formate dehydrogenase subunit gamma [Hyphomicrobiaceae bacterium]
MFEAVAKYARVPVLVSVIAAVAVLFAALGPVAHAQDNPSVRPPAGAVGQSTPQISPDKGGSYDIELWTKLRQGVTGNVSIPDKRSGTLVDSSGETWRALRNGPLPVYGAYALAAMLGLLTLFYLVRGRVRLSHGTAGWTIVRFTDIERTGHWLLATSFIILALTGLNVLYGRYVLIPVIGKEAFASVSMTAKWLHNYVAFAFMAGLVLTFLLWVAHNIPHPRDLVWFARGGGMLGGTHPPAKKFNGGQKVLFWLVMLGGISLALSGLALMFPYEVPMFAKTFEVLNGVGLNLPKTLTPNEEQQLASTWHAIVALGLTIVIFAHIYIGSIGMEGAFDAMGSGEVDANWAREHHSLWAEEEIAAMRESGALLGKAHAAE